MVKLFEADDYLINVVLIAFLLINYNLELGTIYIVLALIDWIAYYIAFDKKALSLIPIEKNKANRWTNLVWAMGAYVFFIFISNFIVMRFSIMDGTAFDNISQLIGMSFSATPVLFGVTYLGLIVWGNLIPVVETKLFFRTLMQWGVKSAKMALPKSAFSTSAILISSFFGALFALFHLVAKGITNNSALLVTFLFGVFSVMLVIHFRELIQAIFLHIITNTIATMQLLRLGFFEGGVASINPSGFLILGGVILVSWFLMFQELPLIKKVRA